jgi:hypothetical protein
MGVEGVEPASGNECHASVPGCANIKSHGSMTTSAGRRPFDQTIREIGLAVTEDSQGTHHLIRTFHQLDDRHEGYVAGVSPSGDSIPIIEQLPRAV